MFCSVICPACRRVSHVPADAMNTPIPCQNCNQHFLASETVAGHGGWLGQAFPSAGQTDGPGVIGLIFGAVAMVCLLMGPFTCGLSLFAAAPLAGVGGAAAFFGKGNMKVAGIALNLLALVPSILLLGLMSSSHH